MTTTLNTSRSENTMILSARVSACMYFLVISKFEIATGNEFRAHINHWCQDRKIA